MNATRAPKGGTIGMNGEHYAGGTFLPNTHLTKMAKRSRGGSGKQKIGVFEWGVAPVAGQRSLFNQFSHLVDWRTATPLADDICRRNGMTAAEVGEMLNRWQAGERWVA